MARRENHSIKIENNEKKNQILVSLSIVALLGGCSEEQVQRDVYQSLDDCLADWKKIELCEADKNTESTQKTETTPQQGLGLNIRDNGNAESVVKNPAENNVQANQSENNAESTTKAESTDPSLGAAIAGGVMGYLAARAISSFPWPKLSSWKSSGHHTNRASCATSNESFCWKTNARERKCRKYE